MHISFFFNVKASTYCASGGHDQFLNAKASTYYASGGQNPFFSDFYDARPKFRIFLCCRYSPGTYLEKRAVKKGVVSAQGGLCATSERRVVKVLLEQ